MVAADILRLDRDAFRRQKGVSEVHIHRPEIAHPAVEGKRGFDRYTRGKVLCSDPGTGAIAVVARAGKIAVASPPNEVPEVIKTQRIDNYRHVATGPRPALAVVEDLDRANAFGVYWGEINTTVHRDFGLARALTKGSCET